MRMLIKNGRVIDPASNTDDIRDILVEDGVIAEVAKDIDKAADTVIDAKGCMVMPGLVDLHVHFREPGFEHKETIRTGARAAARGGFTTVCPMPNTKPAIDSVEMVEYIKNKSEEVTDINILPIAAMTAGQDGEYITDYEKLYEEGAVAVSEDGKSVMNARVARQAMRLAAEVGIPVFVHCEDKDLAARGVMNAGNKARELGFYGIMNSVEDIMVARDLLLAKNTGAKLHICHVSTEDSVRMIAAAKKEGLDVTAEVTPHHLTLTEDDINEDDANYKVNPPLRTNKDKDMLIKGLKDGTIDIIATDHAPHSKDEKAKEFKAAPSGMIGLETSLALGITNLVKKGYLTLEELLTKMTVNPAKLYKMDKGCIEAGKIADLVIFNPDEEWEVTENFVSKASNSPFIGQKLYGKIKYTICNGNVVYKDLQ